MRTKRTPIDDYIAEFPNPMRAVLKRVRSAIREALAGADESISYRIPTFKLHGRPVIYFAGFKEHYSVYPFTATLVEAFRKDAGRYEVNNKGTIRFSYAGPVPARFIARIAKFRARELAARSPSPTTNAREDRGERPRSRRAPGAAGSRRPSRPRRPPAGRTR